MVLPAILGTTLIKGISLIESPEAVDWLPILLGTVMAYGAGIFAIRVVLGFGRRGRLYTFAFYCVGVGVLGLILL